MGLLTNGQNRKTAYNSTNKKLAVQWFNQASCQPQADSVMADSFVLLNPPEHKSANCYTSSDKKI